MAVGSGRTAQRDPPLSYIRYLCVNSFERSAGESPDAGLKYKLKKRKRLVRFPIPQHTARLGGRSSLGRLGPRALRCLRAANQRLPVPAAARAALPGAACLPGPPAFGGAAATPARGAPRAGCPCRALAGPGAPTAAVAAGCRRALD